MPRTYGSRRERSVSEAYLCSHVILTDILSTAEASLNHVIRCTFASGVLVLMIDSRQVIAAESS